MKQIWKDVDRYLEEKLCGREPEAAALDAALQANREAGLPAIDVSRGQGKLLQLLARMSGARRVLEIGTLGGYSTIWLAGALPADGRLVTLELEAEHAELACGNLRRAGLERLVEVRQGAALDRLDELIAAGEEPFDFIFIDADKPNNPAYLERALRLSRPGTVIVADNIVRDGEVIDGKSTDPRVQGIRMFLEQLGSDPRLSAAALQTVGGKGYDGFAVAIVNG
ncbi:O-methyltransferase [Paenibacillus albicereus]|uniref:O-methyltransferase n=1 Tax=Paenibacillus albicereus TaxID=2726185 RepID=A0A6H2H1P0_9BACL|nr:O-methyltransferase [Paenibacillus albicereus]QJC53603.1 O-methyltransferase [Paenibacillus albicereus]